MSEKSDTFKLVNVTDLAKEARVGMELTYFDVIELLGELESLKSHIADLEGLAQQLVWVGNDLLTDNTNPVTITLFSGLAFRSKELLP